MSAEAVIVAGEASESDEEEIVHLSTASRWVFLVIEADNSVQFAFILPPGTMPKRRVRVGG